MTLNLTKSEVATIKDILDSSIDCEKDALGMEGYRRLGLQRLKDWKSIKKKILKLEKRRT